MWFVLRLLPLQRVYGARWLRRLVLTGLLCAATASATTLTGFYRTYGWIAQRSCKDIVTVASLRAQGTRYLEGFLTGFNRGSYRTYSITPTDFETAHAWITGYCRTHGTIDFVEAIEAYIMDAYPQRGKDHTNTVAYSQAQGHFACDP